MKNELILCTQTYNDTNDFRSFGNTVLNQCKINLTVFAKENKYPVYFYQMYLKVGEEIYEIPVTVDNFEEPDRIIDLKKSLNEKSFFKRFVTIFNDLTDNKILFAQNITFNAEMLNKEECISKMKIPYLRIYYDIKQTNGDIISFAFLSDYTMNLNNVMRLSVAFLVISIILTVFFVAARMYIWVLLNPRKYTPEYYEIYFFINLVFTIFKYYGIIIFFYSWFFSIYWYVFYKLQYRPFIFLPSFYEAYKIHYKKFYTVWGLACTMYGCYIMFRIYQQVNSNIFFIDWEHDKYMLENVMGKTSNKAYKSPWRTIHVVNQYNILQKSRTISIPFCMAWLIFLYYSKYGHWDRYAQATPNISWCEKSPENIILRHFVGTFILFISGIAQYVFRRIIQFWIPTRKTEFLDLCCVANVSVFILQDSLRGYYIHGQSPLGLADTTLQQLIQFLEEEGKGKIKGRGITDEKNDDLQTYEIYLSYDMRKIYDGLYFLPTIQEIEKGNQYDAIQNQAKFRNIFKYIPNYLKTGNIYQFNKFMNNHLKTKIEQATMNSKLLIRDKSLLERFFELPPFNDLTNINELLFYRDKGANFDDVLFIGMEIEFLIFVIYTWEMWCISLQKYGASLPISIFMTYVMEEMFYKIRVFFGEKNVAKKAVVDNRFL